MGLFEGVNGSKNCYKHTWRSFYDAFRKGVNKGGQCTGGSGESSPLEIGDLLRVVVGVALVYPTWV